ncbi:MAG: hypothetical protein JWO11_4102 [Nocardioides sp.]|nr:hypothetical protein [Nocardioides sp.]
MATALLVLAAVGTAVILVLLIGLVLGDDTETGSPSAPPAPSVEAAAADRACDRRIRIEARDITSGDEPQDAGHEH